MSDTDTVRWFGKPWPSYICKELPQVPVPVGTLCLYCEEQFIADDSGIQFVNGPYAHRNCFFRMMWGSAAHIEGRCSCVDSASTESDDPGLTKRQGADAAVAAQWGMRHKR